MEGNSIRTKGEMDKEEQSVAGYPTVQRKAKP